MNLWIKIFVSLLFLFKSESYACELVSKNIISLSGPVSTYLDQLGILHQAAGISTYHPVKEYQGDKFAGGLYLSTSTLKTFEGKTVFFDRSREFKKVLERFSKIKTIEVESRRKSPREVIELTELLLKDYLKGCDQKKEELKKRISAHEKYIKENVYRIKQSIFFLGKIDSKIPETVLSNDGFVYWLKEEKLLDSYPSELEYLNWSMKILSPLRGKYFFFGIQDSFNSNHKSIQKVSDKNFNIVYPGALTPGYTQLEFFRYLLDYFLE